MNVILYVEWFCVLDSLYGQSKYSAIHNELVSSRLIDSQARCDNDIKMFRAQRNTYLSGTILGLVVSVACIAQLGV